MLQVRDALAHLHDLPYLQTHPLGELRGKALQRALLDAIEGLRSPVGDDAAGRVQRLLALRYAEALDSRAVAARLGISIGEYYREHGRGVAAVAALLRERGASPGPPPTDAGPASSLGASRTALPRPLTSFVGRERELAEVERLLATTRLLTLTGPPGAGKTRLALETAWMLGQRFAAGAVFVPLGPVEDPALVVPAIARTLGVLELGGRDLGDVLAWALADRELLMVLDNCERVVGAAPAVAELLAACPHLTALATSRTLLRVRGERELRVPPLAPPSADRPAAARLLESPAARLFVERAQAARPDFAPTDQDAPAIAEICRRLDGLPLAIELAAARTRLFTPRVLVERLDDRLRVLTGGARDLQPHQRTLRSAICWSHDLLEDGEQALFRRLAVFAGGFTLEAAAAVCVSSDGSHADPLNGLIALADASLIDPDDQGTDEPRFAMLETLRAYGIERLVAAGEAEVVRRRHGAYFLRLAEEGGEVVLPLQEDAVRHDRLAREQDNLRSALRWFVNTGDAEGGLRLAAALGAFWMTRGHVSEGQLRLEEALALPGAGVGTAARARALASLAHLVRRRSEYARARQLFEESLAIWRQLGESRAVAGTLAHLGNVAFLAGRPDDARGWLDEALPTALALRHEPTVCLATLILGEVALYDRDYADARRLLESALEISRQADWPHMTAYVLYPLSSVALAQGEEDDAHAHLVECQAIALRFADTGMIAHSLDGFACLAAARGRSARALRLRAASDALRDTAGMAPLALALAEIVARDLAPARASLGEAGEARAAASGRAMTVEQAVAYARSGED